MGQAKRRGTFEERKAAAIKLQKELQAAKDKEVDKNYDSLRPYRNSGLLPYFMALYASGINRKMFR